MSNSKSELQVALFEAANQLRSKMDASEYKDYLLGLIFYKYLSDRSVDYIYELKDDEGFKSFPSKDRLTFYTVLYNDEDYQEDVIGELNETFKYAMKPEHTFDALAEQAFGRAEEPFQLENLSQGLREVEQSSPDYVGLFSDMDLNSTRLGSTRAKQSETIANAIKALAPVDFSNYSGDMLGDAYEYLISEFAMSAGKKAGEFYTPGRISAIMSRIAMNEEHQNKRGLTVYDPASGSGSLLLKARYFSKYPDDIQYYGQELNTTTYNLARMNMILHGISPSNYTLRNGDTLDEDWPTDEPTDFDAVVMNPPYSAKWSSDNSFMDDPRFGSYGRLAPKSKADYAFLLHGYYHLKNSGTMAIVLPHGVLFRSGAEGTIREKLLTDGAIDAVIGLPANIFHNTSIPTTIIVLKKDRVERDVFFIDASELYVKDRAQNKLTDEHVDEIVGAYFARENIEHFSHLASFEEIKENDYNLNIPRYVDTFEEEEPIVLAEVSTSINEIKTEIKYLEMDLLGYLEQLTGTDEESDESLNIFIQDFREGVE